MSEYLLALDIGTSTAHCVITGLDFCPIGVAGAPMGYVTPEDCAPMGKEIEPEALMRTVGELVARATCKAGIAPGDITAVGVTSQRQGIAFLGRDGRELYLSPNLDMRAVFQGAAIDESFGEEIYNTTGHFPSLLLATARWRWLVENRQHLLDQVGCVMPLASWLAWRLTGVQASEPSIDGEAGLLDIRTRQRCPYLYERYGLTPDMLPPLLPAGAAAGGLLPSMASRWGLKEGIPVAIGGPDTQCGLLGMGAISEGQTGVALGWSGAIQVVNPSPLLDSQKRTWTGCHPVETLWVVESNLGDVGNAYRWLKELLLGPQSSFALAEDLAAEVPPGGEGVLALLGPGPEAAPSAGLRTGGLFFPVPMAFQEATPGQLLRAALEGVAFSVKAHLDRLATVTGNGAAAIHVCGGMACNDTLMQVLADVTGQQVVCSSPLEASGRGAAMAAATAAGFYSSLELAAAQWEPYRRVLTPSPASVVEYQGHYSRWLEMCRRVHRCS